MTKQPRPGDPVCRPWRATRWLTSLGLATAILVLGAAASAQTSSPRCCGDACGPGNPCCTGAVCSTSGRCLPAACIACGDRGCDVDEATCQATCGPVRCCHESCARDADCCTGTVCRATSAGRQCVPEGCSECTRQGRPCQVAAGCQPVCGAPSCCRERCVSDRDCCRGTSCQAVQSGERLCLPTDCDDCRGMTPHCQIDDHCNPVCIAPVGCGQSCASSRDCGTGMTCRPFDSGVSRCVPTAFQRICRACGTGGCRFDEAACAVVCAPPAQ